MSFVSSSTAQAANADSVIGTIHAGPADNIVGIVFSNVAGVLHVEQSADGGNNWDLDDTVAVAAGVGEGFSFPIYGSAVRLRYVNGATVQTAFRLAAKTSSAGPR